MNEIDSNSFDHHCALAILNAGRDGVLLLTGTERSLSTLPPGAHHCSEFTHWSLL